MQEQIIQTNPPKDCLARWLGESIDDYRIRLCDNKDVYGITYEKIASLLNAENGKNYGESAYRKEYAAFNRGRIYEREHGAEHPATRILAVSDLHVPYNYPVELFNEYVGVVDVLVLNGDIMDCHSISSFPKKYHISIIDEMIQSRQYIIDLVNVIKPSKVIVTKGNHEHRMLKYLTDRLNDDIMNLMPDSPMDLIVNDGFKNNDRFKHIETYYPPLKEVFESSGVKVSYTGEWYCRVGNVIFAHPLAYSSSMMKTAEKAVTYFSRSEDRTFTAIVMSHTHKVGFYKVGDIKMYEQGCCCKLDMLDYANGKLQDPQQNGYMYIGLDKNGNIIENKTRLITDFS